MEWIEEEGMYVFGLRRIHNLMGFLIFFVGLAAYKFKKKNRQMYGVVEIGIAIATGTSLSARLMNNPRDLATWTALTGAAYIVSRGIENFIAGLEDEKHAELAKAPASEDDAPVEAQNTTASSPDTPSEPPI